MEEEEEEEERGQRARSKKYRVTTNARRPFKKEIAIDEIKNGTILA